MSSTQDWDVIGHDAVATLSHYVQFDPSNPPPFDDNDDGEEEDKRPSSSCATCRERDENREGTYSPFDLNQHDQQDEQE